MIPITLFLLENRITFLSDSFGNISFRLLTFIIQCLALSIISFELSSLHVIFMSFDWIIIL
nr:MAG TPA: hypothetical protein [Caudoviricetes sp.]